IQRRAGDTWWDGDREVVRVDRTHLVHPGDVDAHAALHREQMAFHRRTRTERNHRNAKVADEAHGIRDVLAGFCKHDRAWWPYIERRFVPTVLLPHGERCREVGAESLAQRVAERLGHRAV